MRTVSKLGRKIAVDLKADADFHQCGSRPGHSFALLFEGCPLNLFSVWRATFTANKELPRILRRDSACPRWRKVVAKENKATAEQPKEKKTKRELEMMARQRLGCAVPVRRAAKSGWYFQVIQADGVNPGTLQRRANLLAEELGHLYDLVE